MNVEKYYWILHYNMILPGNVFKQEKNMNKANEDFERYAFVDARKVYLNVAKSGYESSDLFKKLGDSYYFNAQLEEAVPWYEKLTSDYQHEIDTEYLFRYYKSL